MKIALLAMLLTLIGVGQLRAENAPLVAVASSLRQVWPILMNEFPDDQKPRVTFGSSGNLARQIIQGAPFNLLLSADTAYTELLVRNRRAYLPPKAYTIGRLAWVAKKNSTLANWLTHSDDSNADFPAASIARLAIANPAFAPYGQAAQDVLSKLGVTINGSIAFTMGENAAQALQFAVSGATDGGILPRSLLSQSNQTVWSTLNPNEWVVKDIDPSMHRTLNHSMVLVNTQQGMSKPTDQTTALYEFLTSEKAQTVFEQHGFQSIP